MKKDYCEYFTDKKGRPWYSVIYCKGCGEKIQDSHLKTAIRMANKHHMLLGSRFLVSP